MGASDLLGGVGAVSASLCFDRTYSDDDGRNFQLYRSPGLDHFRQSVPGILLLGRVFSVWDIVVYWLAIFAGVCLDRVASRGTATSIPERKPADRYRATH